jgi:putative membrane-bound dehydrogenase-like protein
LLSEYVAELFMRMKLIAPVALLAGAAVAGFAAASPELKPEEMPRVPPVEATNALATFQVKPGFHLELVATEPLVVDPIDICFDENGRMVVEMRDYSEMRDVTPHLGRVRMLEDTDGNGVFDQATIYADDLPWPTSVFYYDGGIFVIASPDIFYCKDTNGDGQADVRRVVFTGFGAGVERINMQALPNCLRWGLDNRIHGQTAGNGGLVTRGDATNSPPLSLRGRDFHFDPRSLNLDAEAGGGQYGMAYDDRGRKFACSNSRHLLAFMYDARYAERNPFYNLPANLVDIPVDGPAAEVFRTSPEEMWRVIRTKWRVAGLATGPIEGGGRASGYFTSATGIQIYRGDAFPEEFVGDAFIADVGSNLIHRKKIRRNGVSLIAERPPDEQKVEFITSTDLWFRPVQLANAPDGCLYLCDMYREVIEHPWSLPETIKKLLDLNSGNDRGRIYRITPDGFKPRKPPKLGKTTTAELIAMLEHKNAWHRETASRLLFERQDRSAVKHLENLLAKGAFHKRLAIGEAKPEALGRLHALHALDGLGVLKPAHLLTALEDAAPAVREHAVKLAEKFKSADGNQLWSKLRQLRNDPDALVRYELAFTLGEFNRPGKIEGLVAIAERDFADPWTQAAVLSSLAEGAGEMFSVLAGDSRVREAKAGQDFLRQLVVLVGAKNRAEEVAEVVRFVSKADDPALTFTMTRALGDGLQRAKQPLASAGDGVSIILANAKAQAARETAPESQRVPAIQLLAYVSYAEAAPLLLGLLDLKQPQPVQLAALSTFARFAETTVGGELTARWNTLTPRLRAEALTALLARPDRATALLQAIESGAIRASVLDSTQVKFLGNYSDKSVRQLAAKVLEAKPASPRQQVINEYLPALTLKGDPAGGKKIYEERCISCHRASGEGFSLGPDLVTVKTTGKEKILVNLIDPNAEVRPEFVGYVVETKDDESLLGLVVNETGTSVTLRQAYGREDVIPRANITSMKSQGQSIMPEGLEAGLTPQQMADLLEHISTATQ